MSVSMTPGWTELTRMRAGASSLANCWTLAAMAALAVAARREPGVVAVAPMLQLQALVGTGEALRPSQSGRVQQYGALLFAAAAIIVTQYVLGWPATGLIATSSVMLAVLGFALRNIFGDIFSGIALGMESPYAIGDWIEATEGCAGRVTGISWRSTRLVTRDGVTLVVPNSLIAGHRIRRTARGASCSPRRWRPGATSAASPRTC